jgi:hypothetical protein
MPRINIGGNAVAEAHVDYDNGCYTAYNTSGGRRIKFIFGNISFDVPPGGSHTLVDFQGRCLSGYNGGEPVANYD